MQLFVPPPLQRGRADARCGRVVRSTGSCLTPLPFFTRTQSDTLSDRHDVKLVITFTAVHVEFAAMHPLAAEIPAGHDDGMSQVTAQVPSYESGVSDVPLLGETIGQNLRRTVATYGDREAMVEVA